MGRHEIIKNLKSKNIDIHELYFFPREKENVEQKN